MKIILTPIGSSGDVHPFVGLGAALKARGHRVVVITNDHFEPLIRSAGLDFITLGTSREYLELTKDPLLWHPSAGFVRIAQAIGQMTAPLYELLSQQCGADDAIVVAHSLALGARVAQEKLGTRVVTVHLSPAVLRSEFHAPVLPGLYMPDWTPRWWKRSLYWLADRAMADRHLGPPLNEFRGGLGLPPARRLLHAWWNSPLLTLGLFPDWFAPPQPDWPASLRLTGFPLYDERGVAAPPPGLGEFLGDAPPPIVFTPGSAMRHAQDFFVAAVGACQELGRRGVLLTRFPEQLPPLPPTVRHFDFVPLSLLLPRAAAIVHHGGIGTIAQGLAAGIPQMVMPMAHDQFDNAARVEALGVGVSVRRRQFTAPVVAAGLKALLESQGFAERCRGVRARMQGVDAVGATCAAIEVVGAGHPVAWASAHASSRGADVG